MTKHSVGYITVFDLICNEIENIWNHFKLCLGCNKNKDYQVISNKQI